MPKQRGVAGAERVQEKTRYRPGRRLRVWALSGFQGRAAERGGSGRVRAAEGRRRLDYGTVMFKDCLRGELQTAGRALGGGGDSITRRTYSTVSKAMEKPL